MGKFNEWLQWNFGSNSDWNKKSLFKILGIIGIILLIIFLFKAPDNIREKQLDSFVDETKGTVYKIEPKKTIAHYYNGSKAQIVGYNVYFTYEINGNTYNSKEYILNTNKNRPLIDYIYTNVGTKKFTISYSPNNPKNAMVSIDSTD